MTERCKRNPCCGDLLDCKPPPQFKPQESYSDYVNRTTSGQTGNLESEDAFLAWAYASLEEINPSNYDHEDVCSMNAASVEVMLAIKSRRDALAALAKSPTEAQAGTPAEALPSQTNGAGEAERKPLKMLVSREQMRSMIEQSPDEECEAGVLHPEALAKPASEPAGGGVREALQKLYDGGVACHDLWFFRDLKVIIDALSSPASSSPDEAEALQAGVERKPYDMIVKRLLNPPFGTETSERLLMGTAADAIRTLLDEVRALSPAPAQAGSFVASAREDAALVEHIDEAAGGKTEAVLKRDGHFLTLEWWRHGKYLAGRVYEPMRMKVSAALADLLVHALEERPYAAVPPSDNKPALADAPSNGSAPPGEER